MRPGERSRRLEMGFTYLGLLFLVALIGLGIAAGAEVVATTARREREAQLLWVGHQYRAAIERYWGHRRAYPRSLEELLGTGPDAPLPVHYIRRLYPDPMTNGAEWVLIPAPGGGFMGIASSSPRAPLKVAHFDAADMEFEKAATYGDWQFTFVTSAVPRRRSP